MGIEDGKWLLMDMGFLFEWQKYSKIDCYALTGITQWVESILQTERKVASSTSSQSACLGCWPGPPVGGVQKATDVSLAHWCFLPLSPSLPVSLKINLLKTKMKLIVVMVKQLCEHPKNQWIVHFEWVSYVVCKLYPNKAVIKKKKQKSNWHVVFIPEDS